MLRSIYIVALLFIFSDCMSQQCFDVSRAKDKETGWETYSGFVKSDEFHTYFIGREFYRKDTGVAPNYFIQIYLPLHRKYSLNTTMSFGKMRVQLADRSIVEYDSVRFTNLPYGNGVSIKVYLTDEEAEVVPGNPIVRISVEDISDSFTGSRRKKLQHIVQCLMEKF